MCGAESPSNPEAAKPDLVRAWKASELVSVHLDSADVLANPESSGGAGRRDAVIYQVVDKIVRIYHGLSAQKGITLRLNGQSHASASINPNTFHIIPSAFVDNAIKYSLQGQVVDVTVSERTTAQGNSIIVEVVSEGPSATAEEEAGLFRRQGRAKLALGITEGSGLGLFIAKIVADQHATVLSASQRQGPRERSNWRFKFEIPAIH
jgi:signal transduction histidine kinase